MGSVNQANHQKQRGNLDSCLLFVCAQLKKINDDEWSIGLGYIRQRGVGVGGHQQKQCFDLIISMSCAAAKFVSDENKNSPRTSAFGWSMWFALHNDNFTPQRVLLACSAFCLQPS